MPHTFSRPLDVHRWADYPELNNRLTDLVTEVDGLEVRQRARKAESAKRLRNAVRSLVLDLYVAWVTDPLLEIGVPLSNSAYSRRSRYRALFLKYEGFLTAYHGLKELGYIEEVRAGFHDPRTGRGFVTRARATQKLISVLTEGAKLSVANISAAEGEYAAEGILLRDGGKRNIPYEDTDYTIKMRADLESINRALNQSWIDLYITDAEMTLLKNRMRGNADEGYEGGAVVIDQSRRRLLRIFNNGSWQEGGRFYGGWWQSVPSDYRRYITINGKHTNEIDYSGLHVALLYAEVDAELDGDAYDLGLPQVPRDVIKKAFNKLVNATGRMNPLPGFAEGLYGLSWQALLSRIREKHAPIQQFLHSGYGTFLQNRDAEIANSILLRMIKMGYPCLPVHDSFIVHHGLKDELTNVMREEFVRVTGKKADLKSKLSFLETYRPDNDMGANRSVDISMTDWLDGRNQYAGYDTRQLAWSSRL